MLHGVSFRLLHNPPVGDIQALFTRLRGNGCDAVSIIPHHYVTLQNNVLSAPPAGWNPPWFIWPDLGQDPDHPQLLAGRPSGVERQPLRREQHLRQVLASLVVGQGLFRRERALAGLLVEPAETSDPGS